ncbi:MAG: glycosyltransferase family 61 protein [Pseudomonadota bacterium]
MMNAAFRYGALRAPEALRRAAPLHAEAALPAVFAREPQLYASSPEAGLYELPHGHADRFGGCRDRWGRHLGWNTRSLPRGEHERAAPWHPGVWFAPARRQRGTVATLTHPGQQVYFHWLFDVLPRYALLEGAGVRVDAVYIEQSQPFQRESWALLGAHAPAIDASGAPRLHADTLLVPSAPSTSGVMPPWVCAWLRARFAPAMRPNGGARRLYVSRQRAARGRVRNDGAVEAVLRRHGFATVHAETLSFAQQAALFAGAEAVVGPHGAGLSNLVFAPPGCRVLELFAPGCVNVCYWTLACQLDLPYAFLLGADAPGPGGAARPDIEVDAARLDGLLARLLAQPAEAAA